MDASNDERSRLSQGITAVIFGFFSLGWFGWGRDGAPGWLGLGLDIGTMLAVVVGIGGGAVCFRHRTGDAPATDPSARRRYGIVVGVEFGVVAIVAAVLGASGHSAFISVAIAAVVGVHFYPLASILNDPGLQPLSVLTCLVAVVGLVAGIAGAVAPSAVVGPGVGILLTGYGAWGLVSPARRRISGHAAETR